MNKRTTVLAMAAVFLGACGAIWMPTNRGNQENTTAIFLEGYSTHQSNPISFTAVNRNSGSVDPIGSTTGNSSLSINSGAALYFWYTWLTPPAQYWAPQSVTINGQSTTPNGLATSIGRLEMTASDPDGPFLTFSPAAQTCAINAVNSGSTWVSAAGSCEDGNSLVVFDTNGVGVTQNTNPNTWTPVCCGSSNCTAGVPACPWQDNSHGSVKWQIGKYQSQKLPGNANPYSIYGLVCEPSGYTSSYGMIINHGGYVLDNFALEFCLWGASQGYVTAMTSYRGEAIALGPNAPYGTPTNPYTNAPDLLLSDGHIELCLGEVIDSIQMTSVVAANWNISSTHTVMWGHSHGACVTERAVEAGVKVAAAAAFDAPTDFYNWYTYCPPGSLCDQKSPNNAAAIALTLGYGPPNSYPTTPIIPSQSRIPYDWRSPATYSADLAARKDVHMLLIQGNADTLVEPAQACELAQNAWGSTSINYHLDGTHTGVSGAPAGADTSTHPAPTGCGGANDSLVWTTGAPPFSNWSGANNYLLVYDNQDHGSVVLNGAPWAPASGSPFQDFMYWLFWVFG